MYKDSRLCPMSCKVMHHLDRASRAWSGAVMVYKCVAASIWMEVTTTTLLRASPTSFTDHHLSLLNTRYRIMDWFQREWIASPQQPLTKIKTKLSKLLWVYFIILFACSCLSFRCYTKGGVWNVISDRDVWKGVLGHALQNARHHVP